MIRRPPRSTLDRSSAASDVYKRQARVGIVAAHRNRAAPLLGDCRGIGDHGLNIELDIRGSLPVSYTHLRAHETVLDLVCRLLLEKKKTTNILSSSS